MNSSMEVERQFQRSSAGSYDRNANVQRMMAEQLITVLDEWKREGEGQRVCDILEIGCGTGILTSRLVNKWPEAALTALDIAPGMLRAAERRVRQQARLDIRFIQSDVEEWSTTAQAATFDLIVSGACFQWLKQPEQTIQQLRRLLRPGGLLVFTTFGPETFAELHESFREVYQSRGQQPQRHGLSFQSRTQWSKMLADTGFSNIKDECSFHVETYPSARDFLLAVKAMGASTSQARAVPGLSSRQLFASMYNVYEAKFSTHGGIIATYELLLMQGHTPNEDRESDRV
ncbi:malonyl-ACP O-methyltransferase BioC [Paenibacillus aceris]|uniref:Malonyl-[acyl-carrier protein] O-methyltransferase n=1 Tax=Paenibacillus aceris TaxID=869555 RepID=A0ABS4HUR4_9BACL|nr:malonyl-ACP O-methyltransferase BioC [Paenibacillus aceris]MBP1962368.1 malonyl-CoA O-methyltransferase [Paenibacillus aceris]NHW37184.1 malonyl-ACP O-methyltransferase BioC [Paenibacillus aceris]